MKKSILVGSVLALLMVTGCTGTDAKPAKKAIAKKVEKKVEAKVVEKKVEAKVVEAPAVEALGAPTVADTSLLNVAPVATSVVNTVVAPMATQAITTSMASDATSVITDKAVEFADDKTGGIASQVIETVK